MQYSYSRISRGIYSNYLQNTKAKSTCSGALYKKGKMKKLSIKNLVVVFFTVIILLCESERTMNIVCKCD